MKPCLIVSILRASHDTPMTVPEPYLEVHKTKSTVTKNIQDEMTKNATTSGTKKMAKNNEGPNKSPRGRNTPNA